MVSLIRLLSAAVLLSAALAANAAPVRIAIIIDDLGNNLDLGVEAIALPGEVTYSVLPGLRFSERLAHLAHLASKEVMLHLPMQTVDSRPMGPGGLDLAMSRDEFDKVVRAGLQSVPYAVGVNNHMGSLLTRHPGAMRWLMEDLSCFNRLYFVDSRTDVRTVARRYAREAGLANAQRDVFLDNKADRGYVSGQFRRLIELARERGSAIAIGHPYPETIAVLSEQLPRLAAEGIELVPASELVEIVRSENLWHASSSPLPAVAKNSRQ